MARQIQIEYIKAAAVEGLELWRREGKTNLNTIIHGRTLFWKPLSQNSILYRRAGKLMNNLFFILTLLTLTGCTKSSAFQADIIMSNSTYVVSSYYFKESSYPVSTYNKRIQFLTNYLHSVTNTSTRKVSNTLLPYYEAEYNVIRESKEWPVKCVSRVLLPERSPSKYCGILRNGKHPIDIVFFISSKLEMDEIDAFAVTRKILGHYELLSVTKWAELPINTIPLYDNNKKITSKEVLAEFKNASMVEQR